jgi:hypothetical protein
MPECHVQVRRGLLMCGPHWSQVPKAIQTRVYRTWEAWQRGSGSGRAYLTARDEAVAAVQGQP